VIAVRLLATVAAFSALALFVVPAEAASFANVVLSATKDDATSQANFPIDTPVLYVSADLVDVAATSKLTHGAAPPNYVIDKVDLDVGANNQVDSQLSKPTAGWPAGTYRVDLAIDGVVADTVPFSIPFSRPDAHRAPPFMPSATRRLAIDPSFSGSTRGRSTGMGLCERAPLASACGARVAARSPPFPW